MRGTTLVGTGNGAQPPSAHRCAEEGRAILRNDAVALVPQLYQLCPRFDDELSLFCADALVPPLPCELAWSVPCELAC
jgi:hypothetical protein